MPVPQKHNSHRRETLKDTIYRTLENWIIQGELAPGESLNIQEIADYFDSSRIPVRESLQLLEVQKLVIIRPGRGTYVSDLDLAHLEDIYLPLADLQGLAAKLACRKITEDTYRQLFSVNDRLNLYRRLGEVSKILAADNEFHQAILRLAGNSFITEFSNTLFTHVLRVEHHLFATDKERLQTFSPHTDILSALKERNEDAAYAAGRDNWLTALK